MTKRQAQKVTDGINSIDMENPEFRTLLQMIENTNQSVFLTGKAGTGKSTFLRYIIDNSSKQAAVLAPTGIAAVNVGGQTLHSFFRLPLQPVLPEDPEFAPVKLKSRLNLSSKAIKTFRELDLIIIDEISMVRADMMDLIDKILRQFGDKRRPFGGKQMLLVGDVFQLEPVVTTEDRAILQLHYKNFFFFNADVFQSFGLTSIELRKVYRQKESEFVGLLDRVRSGMPPVADIERINTRFRPSDESDNENGKIILTLAARRDTVTAINNKHLRQLSSPEMIYEGEISGEFPASAFPTDLNLCLKEGAQVIFLRNDPERRWVNGTLGIVILAEPKQLRIRLENGDEHDLDPVVWENTVYEFDSKSKRVSAIIKGSFMQYPVKTAWALTIHKSQGLTFENVDINLAGGAFTGGQVYVALSRCTSLDGIRLNTKIDLRDVFVHPEVIRFSHGFNSQIERERAIARDKAYKLLTESDIAFSKGNMQQAVESFSKALTMNPALNTPYLRRFIASRLRKISATKNAKTRKTNNK